jgi:hypothetical protein
VPALETHSRKAPDGRVHTGFDAACADADHRGRAGRTGSGDPAGRVFEHHATGRGKAQGGTTFEVPFTEV